jgi:hypothetical protein
MGHSVRSFDFFEHYAQQEGLKSNSVPESPTTTAAGVLASAAWTAISCKRAR